ncbi:uncharacterized protein [Eurosta solidaginis]|uniref:uncharacterized protein isoform X2 n=1 Tax=Eurosta solidaginis TaxID=178769 RepID=UPI003530DAA4
MSHLINATKLVGLMLLVFVSNAIELLERNNNELLANSTNLDELNNTNSTETNETNVVADGNTASLRQYDPSMFAPAFAANGGFNGNSGFNGLPGCPLCDTSVYSYCSEKMLHDDCCCDYSVPQLRPPQCYYTDCTLLYAKSCYEHSLIKNCCCNNPY